MAGNDQYWIGGAFGALTAFVTHYGPKIFSKKDKEDLAKARTELAIDSWKELANEHNKNWHDCESRCDDLQKEIEKLRKELLDYQVLVLKLNAKVAQLEEKIS